MQELTPEQLKDTEERQKQFVERYTALTEELQFDFSVYPSYVPLGNGLFATRMESMPMDKKYLPVVSPLSQ